MKDLKKTISKRGAFTKITNPNNGKVLVYKGYFARYSEELIIQCKSEGIKVFSMQKVNHSDNQIVTELWVK